MSNVLRQSPFTVPTIHDFASSVQISYSLIDEELEEYNYGTVSRTQKECIVVNKIFRDENLMKRSMHSMPYKTTSRSVCTNLKIGRMCSIVKLKVASGNLEC